MAARLGTDCGADGVGGVEWRSVSHQTGRQEVPVRALKSPLALVRRPALGEVEQEKHIGY
jgi:hypothetical protein